MGAMRYVDPDDPYAGPAAGSSGEVVAAICAASGWSLRTREVAGLAFLAHALTLSEQRRRLVGEPFRAADDGPSLPILRALGEAHGVLPIPAPRTPLLGAVLGRRVAATALDAGATGAIARVLAATAGWDVTAIEALTHGPRSPWATYRDPGRDVPIPNVAIARWARRVYASA